MSKTEVMIQQHSHSPPPGTGLLQYDLHRLVQRNAGHSSYDHDIDSSHYVHSGQQSRYGSPAPVIQSIGKQQSADRFASELNAYREHYLEPHAEEYGLGISFDSYGSRGAGYHQHDSGSYNDPPYMQSSIPTNHPPTPQSSPGEDSVRRTRSGRVVTNSKASDNATGSGARSTRNKVVKPAARSKKAKPVRSDKIKTPKLTAPLSVLTKDLAEVPVRNMEEWVNRSIEVRLAEVEKRNGYVTRPMNSFMLYRSAFADRTKQWCLQNNHQVVSSVSGESWPLEPPEIREHYNELAKLERINHQNAHPTYKFSPSKNATPPKKRKDGSSEESDISDLDNDLDSEWAPSSLRKKGNRSAQRQSTANSSSRLTEHSLQMQQHPSSSPFSSHLGVTRSSWGSPVHGVKPLPMSMNPSMADMYGSYYHPLMPHHMHLPQVGMDDPHMRRLMMMAPPGYGDGIGVQQRPLIGLPGGSSLELLEIHPSSSSAGSPGPGEPQVDPTLLAYDTHRYGVEHHPRFAGGMFGGLDEGQDEIAAKFAGPEWDAGPAMATMDPHSEFDKWMEDES